MSRDNSVIPVVVSIDQTPDTSRDHESPGLVSTSPGPDATSSLVGKQAAQITGHLVDEENTAIKTTAEPNATSFTNYQNPSSSGMSAAPEAIPNSFTSHSTTDPSSSQGGQGSALLKNSATGTVAAHPVCTLASDAYAIENAGFASDDHHGSSGLFVSDQNSGVQICTATMSSSAGGTFVVTHQPMPLTDSLGTPRVSYNELSCTFGAAIVVLFVGGFPCSLLAVFFGWRASEQAKAGDFTGARWSLKVSVSMTMAALFTTFLAVVVILLQYSVI